MDTFNEYIVQHKKGVKEHLTIIGMVLGAILLIFTLFAFAKYLQSFFLLFVGAVFYLLYVGITMQNTEYEYSVTNGEVDIDKITARRKRQRIISVHSRTFEYFAPLTTEHKNAYDDNTIVQRIDATSNTSNEKIGRASCRERV